MKTRFLSVVALGLAFDASAAVTNYYYFPTNSSTAPTPNPAWATEPQWVAIAGLQVDPGADSSKVENDYIGTLTAPAAYWAQTLSYLYFRTRLNIGTAVNSTTFDKDVFFVIIDRAATSQRIDYAFTWDVQAGHGLELSVPKEIYSTGTAWSTVEFNDRDGDIGRKLAPDFNTLSSSTDGYVRATQYVNGSTTETFLDFAVSWSYLTATYKDSQGQNQSVTNMVKGENFQVSFSTRDNANDHLSFLHNDDFIGAQKGDTLASGFSDILNNPVPEPGTLALLLGAGIFALRRRHR